MHKFQPTLRDPCPNGRLRASLRLLWLAGGLVMLPLPAAEPSCEYPGRPPGPFTVVSDANGIRVSNAVLQISWSLAEQGLKYLSARDFQSGASLPLTGEVFQISLANGSNYASSSFLPKAPPYVSGLRPAPLASRLAARLPGQQIEIPLRSPDGRLQVLWRALCTEGANYVRQEVVLQPLLEDCPIREFVWLKENLPGARTAGQVDGSPLLAGSFFLGSEDPHGLNVVGNSDGSVACRVPRGVPLAKGATLTQSFVLGVAPPGQMRRGFLHYLERERAHPYRPYLHYNSWYDVSWPGFPMNETNCLEAIRLFGENLIRPHGVVMDGMVFDDGWDNPKTLWQFHGGFPNGFGPLRDLCRQYGTRLGVWLSPFGGYGEARAQRLKNGAAQGYETNATGFSLAGPKYSAAFKGACVQMIRQYGANHFKFDGIASGAYANGPGAGYLLDTEAMRRLMLELREEDPGLYINLTTGSWPSPFWLRFADSVWRQGGDMGFTGPGNKQQQWLTYRDREVFRNIVGKGPLYPLNALMTQGVAWSRFGTAAERDFNSTGFKDDVRAFFGAGTSLQELYIQPQRLRPEDWRVLAEAANWSRTNAGVLVDTHWLGGDPAKLEVYGYASWNPHKGIVMLRNPDQQPHSFRLDLQAAFELPPGAPRRYTLRRPWAEDIGKAPLQAEAGQPLPLELKPFEVLIFDAIPAQP
jgi:hypothetical protein